MKIDREGALELLRSKQAELTARGENRYPKREDFTPEQVCAVKAFLGPWPRALEKAGLKPERVKNVFNPPEGLK